MGLGKLIMKGVLIGTVVNMVRSRNRIARGLGKGVGFIAAPRLTRFMRRPS